MRCTYREARSISIHVLRVEDDYLCKIKALTIPLFQSTSSVWRTTHHTNQQRRKKGISIHVLRVEDDCMMQPSLR